MKHLEPSAEYLVPRVPLDIPDHVSTTMIPVPLDYYDVYVLTTPAPLIHVPGLVAEVGGFVGSVPGVVVDSVRFGIAVGVFFTMYGIIPSVLTSSSWTNNCMGQNVRLYFVFASFISLYTLGWAFSSSNHVDINGVFMTLVKVTEFVLTHVSAALSMIEEVVIVLLIISFRKNIYELLGIQYYVQRFTWRDMVTCFSMNRFQSVELTIWKASGVGSIGVTTEAALRNRRTLYFHCESTFNEPTNTRPQELPVSQDEMMIKEKICFNIDPEDDNFCLTLALRRQEIVSQEAANTLAPVGGALAGTAMGGMLLGPWTAAMIGAGVGMGAAQSVHEELAYVEFSNRMLHEMMKPDHPSKTGFGRDNVLKTNADWNGRQFTCIDMVPLGEVWIQLKRITEEGDDWEYSHHRESLIEIIDSMVV